MQVVQLTDGSVYEGELFDTVLHGTGCLVFPNGDQFRGLWVRGNRVDGKHVFSQGSACYVLSKSSENVPIGYATRTAGWRPPDASVPEEIANRVIRLCSTVWGVGATALSPHASSSNRATLTSPTSPETPTSPAATPTQEVSDILLVLGALPYPFSTFTRDCILRTALFTQPSPDRQPGSKRVSISRSRERENDVFSSFLVWKPMTGTLVVRSQFMQSGQSLAQLFPMEGAVSGIIIKLALHYVRMLKESGNERQAQFFGNSTTTSNIGACAAEAQNIVYVWSCVSENAERGDFLTFVKQFSEALQNGFSRVVFRSMSDPPVIVHMMKTILHRLSVLNDAKDVEVGLQIELAWSLHASNGTFTEGRDMILQTIDNPALHKVDRAWGLLLLAKMWALTGSYYASVEVLTRLMQFVEENAEEVFTTNCGIRPLALILSADIQMLRGDTPLGLSSILSYLHHVDASEKTLKPLESAEGQLGAAVRLRLSAARSWMSQKDDDSAVCLQRLEDVLKSADLDIEFAVENVVIACMAQRRKPFVTAVTDAYLHLSQTRCRAHLEYSLRSVCVMHGTLNEGGDYAFTMNALRGMRCLGPTENTLTHLYYLLLVSERAGPRAITVACADVIVSIMCGLNHAPLETILEDLWPSTVTGGGNNTNQPQPVGNDSFSFLRGRSSSTISAGGKEYRKAECVVCLLDLADAARCYAAVRSKDGRSTPYLFDDVTFEPTASRLLVQSMSSLVAHALKSPRTYELLSFCLRRCQQVATQPTVPSYVSLLRRKVLSDIYLLRGTVCESLRETTTAQTCYVECVSGYTSLISDVQDGASTSDEIPDSGRDGITPQVLRLMVARATLCIAQCHNTMLEKRPAGSLLLEVIGVCDQLCESVCIETATVVKSKDTSHLVRLPTKSVDTFCYVNDVKSLKYKACYLVGSEAMTGIHNGREMLELAKRIGREIGRPVDEINRLDILIKNLSNKVPGLDHDDSTNCSRCLKAFTAVRERMLCQYCRAVICHACSLPGTNERYVVCFGCLDSMA
eukprot:PhF_6_TR18910/c0_g1_i1/m.27619